MSDNASYLGDGVYASFDGYHIWLQTGSHREEEATNRIALEPDVFESLLRYRQHLVAKLHAINASEAEPDTRPATEADWQAFGEEDS